MSTLQRFFTAVLPASWAASMRKSSEAWRICCNTCDWSISVWEAGGIRWNAASKGKRTLIRCPKCGQLRSATVEKRDVENPKRVGSL